MGNRPSYQVSATFLGALALVAFFVAHFYISKEAFKSALAECVIEEAAE